MNRIKSLGHNESNLSNIKNERDKKGAVGGQAKQRRSESRSRAAGEAMNGGAEGKNRRRIISELLRVEIYLSERFNISNITNPISQT
jgi:hypothetical protein